MLFLVGLLFLAGLSGYSLVKLNKESVVLKFTIRQYSREIDSLRNVCDSLYKVNVVTHAIKDIDYNPNYDSLSQYYDSVKVVFGTGITFK